jgi:multisubunit Na+/H+ antiporter MnhB subunit
VIGALLDTLLSLAVVGVAVWVLAARSGFAAVIGFVVFGLLLALVWVRLGAIDVALTEAAIGSGATGVILLFAVARLRGGEAATATALPGRAQYGVAAGLAATVGAALAAAILLLPDPAPSLAAATLPPLDRLGIANPVAAVLMAYRGLDTLLEAVVVVFAVIAVWSMAPDPLWGGRPGPVYPRQESGPLALLARVLPPIGIVVGIYLAWVGADAPGGKFQGGTILAAMWVLAWIAGLAPAPAIASRAVRWMLVAGPLVFLAVGLAGAVFAEGFLAYPPAAAKPLILLIEAAMTLSVAAGIALLIAGPPARPA